MENLIKPLTQNKAGRITFYIFEIAGAAIFAISFIASIVMAALVGSFMTWLEYFLIGVVVCLVLYGIGRIIDLNYISSEAMALCECDDVECECNHKHEEK